MAKYLTKLQLGDVIRMAGYPNDKFIVVFVNDCRSRAVNLENRNVSYKTKLTDKEVTFTTSGESFNISPNSSCEILEHRGEKGLQEWVDGNKKDNPRANALLGHTVKDVALAMGRYGWTFEDAKAALTAAGHELAEVTIKKRLRRGKNKETLIREEQLLTLLPAKKKAVAEEDPWKAVTKSKPKAPTKDKKKVRRK